MKRRLRWLSRKNGDGGSANTPKAHQDLRDACAPPQHNTAPLPERPKPQSSADRLSSTPSIPNLSAASSQSLPSSTTNASRAASTSTPQNVQHRTPQDGTSSDANASKKDYWQLAVDQLQKEDSSVADQIAGVQQAAAAAGNADFVAQLLHTTRQGQQEVESKRWKISTGSRELVLRDQFDRLVKVVTLFKDVGNAAGSIDPLHAGLPLAGFCVLMQIVTNDSEQYAAMVAGVEEIVTIVARYSQIEALYLSRPKTVLKQEFERCLLSLYKHIIRYQISATCYYRRNTMLRFIRAFPKLDDVSEVMANIRRDDIACRNIGQVFDSSDALERHQELLDKLDRFEKYLMNQQDPGQNTMQDSVDSVNRRLEERWKQKDRIRCFNAFRCDHDYQAGKKRIVSREPGTCEWVLGHEKYKHWRDNSTPNLLFVTAEPGCGKTVLSKYLVDVLGSSPDGRLVCYYFFKVDSAPQRSIVQAFRALVTQLMSQNRALIEIILSNHLWYDQLDTITTQASTLWEILLACVKACAKEVNFVIDALDECDSGDRQCLIETLNEFYREARNDGVILKVLVTGRPYFNVEFKFQDLIAELPLESHLAGEDASIGGEMGLVIKSQVHSMRLDQHVKDFLIERLLVFQDKTRTYLLLHLIFENIRNNPDLKHANERKLTRLIDSLPTTVFDAYEQFLERCIDRAQADVLLRIVLAAYEPLTTAEVNIAFAIARNADEDFEGASHSAFEDELQPAEDFRVTMRSVCGLFVTIIDDRVYLIHQTARDFLLTTEPSGMNMGLSSQPRWQHSMDLRTCHLLLTRICILYLLFDEFGTEWEQFSTDMFYRLRCTPRQDEGNILTFMTRYPFLEYISKYFLDHLTSSLDVPILTKHAPKVLERQGQRLCTLALTRIWSMGYSNSQSLRDLFEESLSGVREYAPGRQYLGHAAGLLSPHDVCAIVLEASADVSNCLVRLDRYRQRRRMELTYDRPPSPRPRSLNPIDFASLQEGEEGLSTEDYIAWRLPEEEDPDDSPFPITAPWWIPHCPSPSKETYFNGIREPTNQKPIT